MILRHKFNLNKNSGLQMQIQSNLY